MTTVNLHFPYLLLLKLNFRLYLNGISIHLEYLYPAISYPVSRGTQMISPLIAWDHSQDWFTGEYDERATQSSCERKLLLSLNDEDSAYMAGHLIDGCLHIYKTEYNDD